MRQIFDKTLLSLTSARINVDLPRVGVGNQHHAVGPFMRWRRAHCVLRSASIAVISSRITNQEVSRYDRCKGQLLVTRSSGSPQKKAIILTKIWSKSLQQL